MSNINLTTIEKVRKCIFDSIMQNKKIKSSEIISSDESDYFNSTEEYDQEDQKKNGIDNRLNLEDKIPAALVAALERPAISDMSVQ